MKYGAGCISNRFSVCFLFPFKAAREPVTTQRNSLDMLCTYMEWVGLPLSASTEVTARDRSN